MGTDTREPLSMQEASENQSLCRRQKGCFLKPSVIGLLAILYLASLLVTGFLVGYLGPKSQEVQTNTENPVEYYVVDQNSAGYGGIGGSPESAGPSESTSDKKPDRPYVRLPRSIVPVHYYVKLIPFMNGNFSIRGYVEATFNVVEATDNVTIHINDILTMNDTIKLMSSDGSVIPIMKHSFDPIRDFYIASLNQKLKSGERYTLSMDYVGYLNDNLKGFYRSSYKDDEGNTRWLAATQFQATDARKAFPCWDEPGLKANFTVEIAREDYMSAVSNMPVKETVPWIGHQGWSWDKFETSVPMSTYLVAFLVSDFAYLESPKSPAYKFRTYARKSAIKQAEYALQIGPPVSQFFEKFFNVPFPLPKQDMVALPDFSAGAMENWGLITYRETAMLFESNDVKASAKERVGIVIAHELAHQWFGNLVTPEWWTDLWLNEGFASYMEYLGLDSVEPSFKLLEQFVVTDVHSVFGLDCLASSHPINIPVNHPDEINEIFDRISYSKGASIIRMMSHFLTEETFRRGLSKYLDGLKYQSAVQDDLWNYLTKQAHIDGTLSNDLTVKTIMDTWTLQMGFPVINVKLTGDGSAMLSQERFLLVRSEDSTDTHDYKWWVPITFASESNPNFENTKPSVWMSPKEGKKTIQGLPATNEWVIFNVLETGYYRVNYETANWDAITRQLLVDHTVISTINRAQIIDDSLTLSRAGLLSYDVSLKILSYLKSEDEYVPWRAALSNLGFIKTMLRQTGGYGSFRDFLLTLIVPMYNKLGFEDNIQTDPHLEQKKRALIIGNACSLGHKPCLQEAVKLYAQMMANPENTTIVSPNMRYTVNCYAIAEGGLEEWRFAWSQYEKSNIATKKNELLMVMGCAQKTWILSGYLARAISADKGIRKQDARTVISSIAGNSIGKSIAWEFVKDGWQDILDYYGSVSFTLSSIIKATTGQLNTRNQVNELLLFKKSHQGNFKSAKRAVDQAIENSKNNLAWMNKNYDEIMRWLQENDYDNSI